MDIGEVLTTYSRSSISLPWSRYSMYMSAAGLVSISCICFGYLISVNPWFSVLGIGFALIFLLAHPAYYIALDEKKGVIRAKPFIAWFYLSYILIAPTLVLVYLGFGRSLFVGEEILPPDSTASSAVTTTYLSVNYDMFQPNSDYFETTDGFVAYNLSKSVVHTLQPHLLDISDSIYFGLDNPVIDSIYGPTNATYSDPHISELNLFNELATDILYPDIISQWTIAPIFQAISDCLTEVPPIHVTCILANVVVGWAVATDSSSTCRAALHSSACTRWNIHNHSLSVYYPEVFTLTAPVVEGMQGLLVSSPPQNIVEAFKRRFVADGWPFDVDTRNYPNGMPSMYVQLIPNVKANIEDASSSYTGFQYAASALIVLLFLSIFLPFYFDVRTDLLLLELIWNQKLINAEIVASENRREERRRRVAELSIN